MTVDATAKLWGTFATVAMAIGVLVYVVDRPASQVYLLPSALSFTSTPGIFVGAIDASLPSFLHVYAFSLLTAAVTTTRAPATIAGAWCATELLFELGQHPAIAPAIAAAMPAWFSAIPLLENIGPYFVRGTFDPADISATIAGALIAYLTIIFTRTQKDAPSCPRKHELQRP